MGTGNEIDWRAAQQTSRQTTTAGALWGIVLAGGEGTRVRAFLQQLCGGRGIKQFCAVVGRRSMLEHTLARTERLIPRERILVIVSTHHREEAKQQLAHWPPDNIIAQPASRNTAPGILLPLAYISHRDSSATVAIFPSDHFILDEARFIASVSQAVAETQRFPQQLTLLGMTPDGAEEGYGWLEVAEAEEGRATQPVRRFWEKPSIARVQELLRRGAFWNSFVGVAQAETIWAMSREVSLELSLDFQAIRRALTSPHAKDLIARVYQTMQPVNFSSGICEQLPDRLRVLPVPEVGWSDWGSENRILSSLQRLGKLADMRGRLRYRRYEKTLPATSPARNGEEGRLHTSTRAEDWGAARSPSPGVALEEQTFPQSKRIRV